MIAQLLDALQVHLQSTSPVAYLLAYLGGVLISFSPCVYPVAPITIAYIGAHSRGTKGRGFVLSLFYVIGMAITYTVLGGIASLSGMLFGQLQSNPWMYFFVANICVIMALSLLDVFILPVKNIGFITRLQQNKKVGGPVGSLFVGAFSGLILGPCTTPVLAVLLSYVAGQQNPWFGMSMLFVFSLGMGTLLIVLGTFAGLLTNLPKSGVWMLRINRLAGIILLAMGEYFLVKAGMFWI
jgi:thiol:disulfide interchange protein DsbD